MAKNKDFFNFNKAINWNKLTSERASEHNKKEFVQDV